MKIGVFTVLYQDLPLEGALDRIRALGAEAVEISTPMIGPLRGGRRGPARFAAREWSSCT